MNEGFYAHVSEALKINKLRRSLYAGITNGKSYWLSTLLILAEVFTLPIAKRMDRKAEPLNKSGCNVVKNDFVPMDILEWDASLEHQNAITKEIKRDVKKRLRSFVKTWRKDFSKADHLKEFVSLGMKEYRYIEQLEEEQSINFIMSKHMLESVIFIAHNGVLYAEQSDGESLEITSKLIQLHRFAVKNAWYFDIKANKFHQQNVGILVNDLPTIDIDDLDKN